MSKVSHQAASGKYQIRPEEVVEHERVHVDAEVRGREARQVVEAHAVVLRRRSVGSVVDGGDDRLRVVRGHVVGDEGHLAHGVDVRDLGELARVEGEAEEARAALLGAAHPLLDGGGELLRLGARIVGVEHRTSSLLGGVEVQASRAGEPAANAVFVKRRARLADAPHAVGGAVLHLPVDVTLHLREEVPPAEPDGIAELERVGEVEAHGAELKGRRVVAQDRLGRPSRRLRYVLVLGVEEADAEEVQPVVGGELAAKEPAARERHVHAGAAPDLGDPPALRRPGQRIARVVARVRRGALRWLRVHDAGVVRAHEAVPGEGDRTLAAPAARFAIGAGDGGAKAHAREIGGEVVGRPADRLGRLGRERDGPRARHRALPRGAGAQEQRERDQAAEGVHGAMVSERWPARQRPRGERSPGAVDTPFRRAIHPRSP
jgi:hypothetical protein